MGHIKISLLLFKANCGEQSQQWREALTEQGLHFNQSGDSDVSSDSHDVNPSETKPKWKKNY